MNNHLYQAALVFILSSCSITTTIPDFSSPPKNPEELIIRVNSKNSYPEWLNLKGRMLVVKKDQEITLNINIKSRRDSIIWISASGPFGVEIIRAQLTPDSIYFINRINKTYLIKPALKVNDFIKSGLSFYDFQDIITATPKILKKNYKFDVDETGFHLGSDNFSYSITNNYRVQNVKLIHNNTSLELVLDDYQDEDNFPRKVVLKVDAEEPFETTIKYSKLEFSKSQKILFEIPNSYDKIK